MLEGFRRRFKPLEILTEGQVDAIWEGILDVLEKAGLKFDVETPKALKIFDDAGCEVNYNTKTVRFPRNLVTECLSKCPSSFRITARDPKNDVVIGGDRTYVQPGPGMKYIDIDNFEPREATRKEFYDAVTIYDALPNLHVWHANAPNTSFEGVPPVMAGIETYVARARNSTKVNRLAPSFGNHIFTMEIAKVEGVNGVAGNPASSPLCWDGDVVSTFIDLVQAGCVCAISSGPVWGASSPATTAGTMVSWGAEGMGLLVLAQLIRPGHPIYMTTLSFPQNMRTGDCFFGNIQLALGNAVFHQIWRRYKIPTMTTESGVPNSKCMDFQSGYEKGMLALAAAICGAHVLWIHGTIHGELTAHPVQAIMDDDIAGMIGHFLEGVEVNDETLAVELIKRVGSGPDFFLNKGHTRKWWRKEQFLPVVADALSLPEWLSEGRKTTIDRAKERMDEILATHKVSIRLTASQEEEIERILAEARKFYTKKGRM